MDRMRVETRPTVLRRLATQRNIRSKMACHPVSRTVGKVRMLVRFRLLVVYGVSGRRYAIL